MQMVPTWIDRLEKPLGWLAVPKLAILFISMQAFGTYLVVENPERWSQLALVPSAVLEGEWWRLLTFLALPISTSVFWQLFVLLFLYFVINSLEEIWGPFKTTFYFLISWIVAIGASFALGVPVTSVRHFESTLFLAAALLMPDAEVMVFFVPAKMKWLAVFSLVLVGLEFFQTDWKGKLLLLAIYSSFLLFFGPTLLYRVKQILRKKR